jgi:hypothetical protein
MPTTAATILAHLKTVDAERVRRAATPRLGAKVVALKRYQQQRFSHTYADLLSSSRYGAAARFFLDELYGPSDFTQRDAQFARVVPALVRLFPTPIVETVAALAELHALSETLDTLMGAQLDETDAISGIDYVVAWQATGRVAERDAQIALTLDVAGRLDRFTRGVLVRNSLRFMRGPARAAELTDLQRFLETGFDTFRAMQGAQDFIETVSQRERALASALFGAALSSPGDTSVQLALACLP